MPEQTCNPEYVYRVRYDPTRTVYNISLNNDGEIEVTTAGSEEPIDISWDPGGEWALCPQCSLVMTTREAIRTHLDGPGNRSLTP